MQGYSARDLVRVPGLLSLSRLPLAIAFVLAVDRSAWAVGVLALAGLTDVLDGWYARRHDQTTETGALLDAIMDKVFVIVVVVTLVASQLVTALQVFLLATRELGEMAIGARLAGAGPDGVMRPHPPNVAGKVTTLLQYATVTAAVVRGPTTTTVLAITTAVVGIVAAVVYWLRERASLRPAPGAR